MIFLGIEDGATRSTAALVDENGFTLKEVKLGPCNLALFSDAALLQLKKSLREIKCAGLDRKARPYRLLPSVHFWQAI